MKLGLIENISKIIILVGILGLLKNRRNDILMLISIELIFIGISIGYLDTGLTIDDMEGILTSIIILCISATESAIGLTILLTTLPIHKIQSS